MDTLVCVCVHLFSFYLIIEAKVQKNALTKMLLVSDATNEQQICQTYDVMTI